jgi:phosphate transport system permease protein
MATPLAPPAPAAAVVRPPREDTRSWPLIDRVGYWLCWSTGIGLCLIAASIVAYMLVKGLSYLKPSMLTTSPAAGAVQSQSGGFLDPIEGTFIITCIGIAIAAPMGVAIATWLSEYGRPRALARSVDSAIEIIAGAPSVVLALFGLILFSQGFLGFLSQNASNGAVYGRSFFAAGGIMAFLALPLIVGATREGLAAIPMDLREASFALGKTKATTIRHVLLPACRPSIASGAVLGMGRIIGDTAIITILLGVTLKTEAAGSLPLLGTLKGTGSTLTSYVYGNSPAGEGNSHEKAYAAAFVLMLIVVALNMLVTRMSAGDARRERRWFARLSPATWRLWWNPGD